MAPTAIEALGGLRRRGDVSSVVKTPIGLHLFVLLEVVPGHTASDQEIVALCKTTK
jgi:hypothetical protein